MKIATGRSRFGWVLLATVCAMAVTARLGWWQLDRAAVKSDLLAQWQARVEAPTLEAADLLRFAPDDVYQRSVELHGHWVSSATVFLDNRSMQGQAGFVVVTPLRLQGSEVTVLVQRGWVSRDFQDRTRLPALPSPEGPVHVQGQVAPPPSQLYALGQDGSGPIRQNIDIAAYADETGLALLPLSVQQTGPPEDAFRRAWPAPGLDVSKHHGYAFQWFALCALIGLLYVWFQLIAPRRSQRS